MTSNLLDIDFNQEPSINPTILSEMEINEDELKTWVKSQREYNDRYNAIPVSIIQSGNISCASDSG